MYWLIRGDTRAARLAILRLRIRAIRFGDDFAETYLALDAAIYGLVCLAPGATTGSPTFHVIAGLLHGDNGVGALFTVLAVALSLSALRLIRGTAREIVLLATLAIWVGMSVGFFAAAPASLAPYISILNAYTAWIAYTGVDR